MASLRIASKVIHPHAHVENSTIGKGTKVWQFASVIRGADVGEDCNIASSAIIDGAILGDGCLIGHGSSINPGTRLGDNVFVGPLVTICNDRWPRVGKDGFDVTELLTGKTTVDIGDGVSIGAGAQVLPGVMIGEGAVIAAGSTVIRNVKANYLHKRNGEVVPLSPRSAERMPMAGSVE
jgi:UDP-2-acetamido-3-amino-2,3-dideoxy-glucuronate N-acetyltransferase